MGGAGELGGAEGAVLGLGKGWHVTCGMIDQHGVPAGSIRRTLVVPHTADLAVCFEVD